MPLIQSQGLAYVLVAFFAISLWPATQGLSPGSTYTATVGQFASDSRQRPALAVREMGSRIWTGVFVDVRHTNYDSAEF